MRKCKESKAHQGQKVSRSSGLLKRFGKVFRKAFAKEAKASSSLNGTIKQCHTPSITPYSDPVADVYRQKLIRQSVDKVVLTTPKRGVLELSSSSPDNGIWQDDGSTQVDSPNPSPPPSPDSKDFKDAQVGTEAHRIYTNTIENYGSDKTARQGNIHQPRKATNSNQLSEPEKLHKLKAFKPKLNAVWAIYLGWLHLRHETELSNLRDELFVAEATVKSREVDIENNRDDFEADLETTKGERDEAKMELATLQEELRHLKASKRESQRSMKGLKKENDVLKKQSEAWEVRHKQAATVENKLNDTTSHPLVELNLLAKDINLGTIIDTQKARLDFLQNRNQELSQEIEEMRGPLDYARVRLPEQQEEIEKLRAETKAAVLEFNYAIRLNQIFATEMEEQPGNVAHLDGHLKRKDEMYEDLRQRYDVSLGQKGEQQKLREVDRENFEAMRAEWQQKRTYLEETVAALESSRDKYRNHNEEILALFTRKIFEKDFMKALNDEFEILKMDNQSLICMIRAREIQLTESKAEIPPLKIRVLELENAINNSVLTQRQLQAEVNGLDLNNKMLDAALTIQNGDLERKIGDLETGLKAEKQKFEYVVQNGNDGLSQLCLNVKDHEIAWLKSQVEDLHSQMCHWHSRAVERADNFDPVLNSEEVWDWRSEGMRLRLKYAERTLGEWTQKLKERGLLEVIHGEVDPRHAILDANEP